MTEAYAERTLQSKLSKFASHVLRGSVRFEDVNGPRGGVDTVCRVKVMLKNLEPVIVEERATGAREAVDIVADGVERAVRRAVERTRKISKGGKERRKTPPKKEAARAKREKPEPNPPPPAGSYIGRRVGHGEDDLADARDRPEKRRRDAYVDTSAPGTSATDRRAGGGSTARRNTKKNDAGMTSMLEDSAKARPSRKSTRKSADRSKRDSNLARRTKRAVRSPKARATRARARAARAGGG